MKKVKLSFVTCSNNLELYKDCAAKSVIDENAHERVMIDNTNGDYDLPKALNYGREISKGDIVVYCHQDVIFPEGWIDKLFTQINIIEKYDQHWGVLGVMGVQKNGFFAGNIQDPHLCRPIGRLPCRVLCLDEVILIIKKRFPIKFDTNLKSFHFYGADLCLESYTQGYFNYAIDAPVFHISGGMLSKPFYDAAEELRKKWSNHHSAPYVIETTCGVFLLSKSFIARLSYVYKSLRRKIIRRLQRR